MSGLALPLLCSVGAQVLAALPLLLPYPFLHGPSVHAFQVLSRGAGLYVGATLVATVILVFCTSTWEYLQVQRRPASTEHKAALLAVQETQAQLVSILCVVNLSFYPLVARLAREMVRHERLRKSHAALQRQAQGLSQEYTRATARPDGAEQEQSGPATSSGADAQKVVQDLETQLSSAKKDKVTAEARLRDVTMQAKNLERAYDALMQEHANLQRQHGSGAAGSKKAD